MKPLHDDPHDDVAVGQNALDCLHRADQDGADVELRHMRRRILNARRGIDEIDRPRHDFGDFHRCSPTLIAQLETPRETPAFRMARSLQVWRSATGQAFSSDFHVEPRGRHGERAVGIARPFLLRPVAIELDAVLVRDRADKALR